MNMNSKTIHPDTEALLARIEKTKRSFSPHSEMPSTDKLSLCDEAFITNNDGSVTMLHQPHDNKIIGEVIVERVDLLGNVLFTYPPEYNDVIMTGSTAVLEKMFGVRANLSISTLSQDMNINAGVLPSLSNLPNEQIIGFMVGSGGAGETIGDVYAVPYTNKAIPSLLPFRMTTVALDTTNAAPYFMTGLVNGKYCYYGKKFDTTPQIYHLFTDGTEVPSTISQTGTTKGIRVFAEMVCLISNNDMREYFNNANGNLDQCRINTLGLVSGYPAGADYGGIRLISQVNFRSRYLTNADDQLRITYRMYAL